MGRDKAFLATPPEGTLLIDRQTALLRSLGSDDLLISGRAGVDYRVSDARSVADSVPECGPLAGIAALLAAARHPWLLVIAVDLPHLTSPYLEKLIASGAGPSGAVPSGNDGYEPLVALYPKSLLPVFERALAEGRFSLQPLLRTAVADGSLRSLAIEPSERTQFVNWNAPEDIGR
jgi:molybdopterin-guanine dinucleotide biosynthesis protein A